MTAKKRVIAAANKNREIERDPRAVALKKTRDSAHAEFRRAFMESWPERPEVVKHFRALADDARRAHERFLKEMGWTDADDLLFMAIFDKD